MHRRTFLATAAALAAGCGRRPAGPAPTATPDDLARIRAETAARARHLDLLQRFRVPPTATRTTPKPPADVLATAPELKGLIKVAVRLHPRYSDEPTPDESKLGGRFLWPTAEPWPTCEEHGIPFVPVLQLRQQDAPPTVAYRPDTDLMQLLWCPRDHLTPTVVWRKRADVTAPADAPPTDLAFPGFVPVPCRVFPERVLEFPPAGLLPPSAQRHVTGLNDYDALLSACPGTKVGGWPSGVTKDQPTACDHCRRPTDFLLTVSGAEWGEVDWTRWMPTEEQPARSPEADQGYGRAAGLSLKRPVNVFICRRCDGWPVRVVG
ncbi:MAG TPA: hypothetical protein VFG68_02560 [Fimbriiglobus sp.]|nr:hypothetical protein [Fimbriiglobus sp.]